MMAEYRKIIGFPYSVSSDGQVRNDRTGYILKPVKSNCGYMRVGLWVKGYGKLYSVHRLVAEAFVQNPDGKPEVNHKDGNKENNAAINLEWVTGKENKRHCREILGKINKHPDPTAAHIATMKKIRCLDTGEIFESITSAAKSIGVSQSTLSVHLIKKTHDCKGKRFEYAR